MLREGVMTAYPRACLFEEGKPGKRNLDARGNTREKKSISSAIKKRTDARKGKNLLV